MIPDSRARELAAIGNAMFTRKGGWDSLCGELASIYYPLRSDFTTDTILGADFASDVSDGFTINTRETLGNAISSLLRQGQWFALGTGDDARDGDTSNARALQHATSLLSKAIYDPRAGFVTATNEADHDWVAFGSPVLSVEASVTRAHLRFKAWHPKLCAWMINEDGKTDTLHRKMRMPVRDLIARIDRGKWNGQLDNTHRETAKQTPMQEVNVRHILMPTDEIYGYAESRTKGLTRDFVSIYIDMETEQVLHEAPVPFFTYVTPRWRQLSTFAQGFSPAAVNTLPDGRMLQAISDIVLEAGEKAVDPPLLGASNILRNDVNLYAGGLTMVDLEADEDIRQKLLAIQNSQGIPIGLELKQDARQLIAEGWLLNKLSLPNLREMTAYEINERVEEYRRAALPFFNPVGSEYHTPLLTVAFDMAIHIGLIDQSIFPPALHDHDVAWAFDSPLTAAEGQKTLAAFNATIQTIAAGAQVDNQVGMLFDVKQATIDGARGAGALATWFVPEDQMDAKKKQADQLTQANQAAGALERGAQVANSTAVATQNAKVAGLLPAPDAGSVPAQ